MKYAKMLNIPIKVQNPIEGAKMLNRIVELIRSTQEKKIARHRLLNMDVLSIHRALRANSSMEGSAFLREIVSNTQIGKATKFFLYL